MRTRQASRTSVILLARHGETAENAAGRILGRRDPPLGAAGISQARRLGASLAGSGVAALWTSPLARARTTAELAGPALGLRPVVLEDLIESDRGSWEGRTIASIAAEDPELHAAFLRGDADFAFPGGESMAEQTARTSAALTRVAEGVVPALVVAHAGTVRCALRWRGRAVPPESSLGHGEVVAVLDGR